jgi:hypothetical protein
MKVVLGLGAAWSNAGLHDLKKTPDRPQHPLPPGTRELLPDTSQHKSSPAIIISTVRVEPLLQHRPELHRVSSGSRITDRSAAETAGAVKMVNRDTHYLV